MGISLAEAKAVVAEFRREYPVVEAVTFVVKETQEDIYGPQATKENVGVILGGYFPGTVDREGRFSGGRCDLPVASLHSLSDLRRSLHHELLGHFALNTFTPEEKRAVLTAIANTRSQEGIAPIWMQVDKNYAYFSVRYTPNEAELRKAEEVYATACEYIRSDRRADIGSGLKSLRETCIERSRPIQAADLARITEMVAEGLRDRTRSQQTFPRDPSAQFFMAENTERVLFVEKGSHLKDLSQ